MKGTRRRADDGQFFRFSELGYARSGWRSITQKWCNDSRRLNQLDANLLQAQRIATTYPAALQHRGINPNVSSIVLGCCAQDAIVLREIALRQRRHHAAGARPGDAQLHIPDRERSPDPGILHEILFAVRGFYHDVGAKPPNLETPVWIQRAQAIECGCGQQMHHGTIEKRTLGQTEVSDGIPVIEAFDVWPVLLGSSGSLLGQCGYEFHLTLENIRQGPV